MKKVFLLGTMLGVTTAALAFGGMFNHGSKSTTYKGGVDAIGVHIDGNNSRGAKVIVCADNEEPWEDKCLPKCEDGLERNTDGSCTVCANGNVYLSYMPEITGVGPCDTETSMNQIPCETGSDCYSLNWHGGENCCDTTTHTCKTGLYNGDIVVCPIEDNKFCKSNRDCAKNEFCNLMSQLGGEMSGVPDSGTCLPLDEGITYTYHDENYLGTLNNLNRWSSENWCKAHNKNMISAADFGFDLGQNFEGSCDKSSCEYVDWDGLNQAFPTGWPYWLTDMWGGYGLMIYLDNDDSILASDDAPYFMDGYGTLCK